MAAPARRGIRRRVLLLTATGVLLPMALFAWAGGAALAVLERQLGAERQAQAALLAAHVDHVLGENLQRLAAFSPAAAVTAGAGPDSAATEAVRRALVPTRLFRTVLVADAGGRVLWRQALGAPDEWIPSATEIASVARAGRPRAGAVQQTPQGPRLALFVPLHEGGDPGAAVAAGTLAPDDGALTSVIAAAVAGRALTAELVDEAGVSLAVTPGGGDGAADQALVTRARLGVLPWTVVLREPHGATAAVARRLRLRLLALAPLLLLAGLFFAHGAARSLTDPLAALTAAAERITAGDIERPIPALADDEVGRLGRALETMRVALQASLAEVRRANQGLERRVEERTREIDGLNRELILRDKVRGKLLAKVISAQEDERKRIARELHDETGAMLAAVALRLDRAAASDSVAEMRAGLAEAKALAARTTDGVHRLIFALRPSVLDDLGLVAAIRWYAQRALEPRGIAVRCELEAPEERLPPELETALFRAVQEALTNVARHAEAEDVLIQLSVHEGILEVEIEDDGRGFSPDEVSSAAPSGRGLGLMGIRERLELVGGGATIESSPGRGTRVVLRAPLPVAAPVGRG